MMDRDVGNFSNNSASRMEKKNTGRKDGQGKEIEKKRL